MTFSIDFAPTTRCSTNRFGDTLSIDATIESAWIAVVTTSPFGFIDMRLASFTRIGRIDSVLVDAGALRVGTLHQQIALFAAVGAQWRGRAAVGAQTAVAEADRFVGLALALCAVFARDRFDDLREEVGDGGAVDAGDVEHAHVVRDVGAQHTCLQRVFGARVAFESAQRLLRIKVAKVGVLRRQLRVAKLRH